MLDDLNCDLAGTALIEGTALRPIELLPGFFVDLGFEGIGELVLVADGFHFPRGRVLCQVLIRRLGRCAQMSKHKTLELKTRSAEVQQ
jgi:hypothetical protein